VVATVKNFRLGDQKIALIHNICMPFRKQDKNVVHHFTKLFHSFGTSSCISYFNTSSDIKGNILTTTLFLALHQHGLAVTLASQRARPPATMICSAMAMTNIWFHNPATTISFLWNIRRAGNISSASLRLGLRVISSLKIYTDLVFLRDYTTLCHLHDYTICDLSPNYLWNHFFVC
jgi:hypothetical protein